MKKGQKSQLTRYILATLTVGMFGIVPVAQALPVQDTGHTNTTGSAINTSVANKMGITSTASNNVMNWKTFSIANGEKIQFDTNNYLNLVRGTSKSEINGVLTGGGNIYLINPNGILFGSTAQVNVGNLVASTRAITDADQTTFLAGNNPITTNTATAAAGDIINLGKLQTANLVLEGNNITIQNAADITSDGTTALTSMVTAKAAGNITVGHQVTVTTTRSFNIDDKTGKSKDITVPDYKNATAAASGYTTSKLDGTTANAVKESMLVYNVYDLQNMDTNLKVNYMLANDIDATSTNTWNWNSYKGIYKGFQPIGGSYYQYTGTFDGAGHVIKGLTSNLTAAGLFTINKGVIQNVGFVEGSVTGGSSSTWIGGVVGLNLSTINNVYNTGTVSITGTYNNKSIGGVAGYNSGSIVHTHNAGMVSGTGTGSNTNIGGVAGTIDYGGTITNSYNTGEVSGTGAYFNIGGVAGLVGNTQSGSIVNSYNTGTVSGAGGYFNIGGVAGLVGKTVAGTITESYNTGTVSGAEGNTEVGGVAGKITNASTITDSHNEGTVHMDRVSYNDVGGIVGVNESSGSVARVYNSGEVSIGVGSQGNVGGVMGNNKGTGSITDSYNKGKVCSENGNASITIGGVVGLNASGPITKVYNTGEISSKNTSSFSKGGVVGKNAGGVITNVYNTGSLTDNGVAGYYYSTDGGVVGYNQGTITNAYNTGEISSLGASSESNNYTGGVVGRNKKNTKITNVYNTGSVSGTYDVGGVIGKNDGEATATLANAYNTGAVSSTGSTDNVGGVVGENINNDTITNALWAKDLSYTPTSGVKPTQAVGNQADTGTVKGETLANMKKAATYDKWTDTSGKKIVASEGNKNTAWRIYEGNTTPLLTSFFKGIVTVTGLSNKSAAYSGTAQTADISGAVYSPTDIDHSHIYAGSNRNAGIYSAIYSDQQGYDLVNTNTLTITPVTLTATLTGKTGNTYAFTKDYDGTDSVTKNLVLGTTYTFGDQVISGDTVSIDAAKAVGAYAGKNVGYDKTISYTGITLTGADAGNYTIADTLSGNVGQITKKDIKASLNDSYVFTKIYDGNTDVKQALGNNYSFATGDIESVDAGKVSLTAGTSAYTDKNAGNTKEVTFGKLVLGGDEAKNYNLKTTSLTGNVGQINKKSLVAELKNNASFTKVYDGTTAVNTALALGSNYAFAEGDVVNGDTVSIDAAKAVGAYADKNAGDNKNITFSNLTLNGTSASNYTIASTLSGAVGRITKKSLVAEMNNGASFTKVYDGTTAVNTALVLDSNYAFAEGDVVTGDAVSIDAAKAVGAYADKNAGSNKAVNFTNLTLTGADAGNYELFDMEMGIDGASITPKALTATLTGDNAFTKVYDGTTAVNQALTQGTNYTLDGIVADDQVSVAAGSGAYNDKNAGDNKMITFSGLTLTGAGAGNYTIASTLSGAVGQITRRTITGSLTSGYSFDKVYDGTTTASLGNGYTLSGVVVGDNVPLTAANGFYDSSAVGDRTVTFSGFSINDGNYLLSMADSLTGTGKISSGSQDHNYSDALAGVSSFFGANPSGGYTIFSGAPGDYVARAANGQTRYSTGEAQAAPAGATQESLTWYNGPLTLTIVNGGITLPKDILLGSTYDTRTVVIKGSDSYQI